MIGVKKGVLSEFQQKLYDQWQAKFYENTGMTLEEYWYACTDKKKLAEQKLLTKEEIEQRMEAQRYNEVLHDINALEQMSYLGNRYSFQRDVRQHKYSDCDHCYL